MNWHKIVKKWIDDGDSEVEILDRVDDLNKITNRKKPITFKELKKVVEGY